MERENLPTAQTTLVILLGASKWPRWPDLNASEAFAHSAQGIKTYFLDEFHLPRANLLDLFDSGESADEIDHAINHFLHTRIKSANMSSRAIRDVLVFFIGHAGFTEVDLDYYLALQRTRQSNPELSALRMASLAKTLRKDTRELRLMLILDCCYAAAAFKAFQFQGGSLEEATRAQIHEVFGDSSPPSLVSQSNSLRKGIALLCSSSRGRASSLDGQYTEFSEALLKSLYSGYADKPGHMSLYTVGDLVQRSLKERRKASKPEVHSPDQRDGDIAAVPFFPNPQAPTRQMRPAIPSQVSSRPGRRRKWLMMLLFLVLLLSGGSSATWFVEWQQQQLHNVAATATTLAFAPLATATARAATQAYWEGISRNGVQFGFDAAHTHWNPYERVLNAANVAHVRQLWSFQTGHPLFGASPVVANGMVFIGSDDGKFYAFDATCRSRCQPRWSFTNGGGLYASPTVANGIVYIGSLDGKLYAFDATCRSRCQPLWSFQTGYQIIDSSPAVANGTVYFGTNTSLYTFDATCRRDCQPLWSFNVESVDSSPAIANGMVYLASLSNLFAFDATCHRDCQPLWSFKPRGLINSSPAVANGMVYLSAEDYGKLYAFDASCRHSCQPLWSFITGESSSSSPTVANGVVYLGSGNGNIYAFDATCRRDCQPLWSFSTGKPVASSPAVANGVIYIGSNDGRLYALGIPTLS